jgi:hypothetical protein
VLCHDGSSRIEDIARRHQVGGEERMKSKKMSRVAEVREEHKIMDKRKPKNKTLVIIVAISCIQNYATLYAWPISKSSPAINS